ncbi:hypothetical protein AAFF_G00341060 [Aldrovandia affinis]|uniref:Uncharacterized protein n=1 Tax=Aldrovandia affinis TaxID=143900 RepID=A0AAD7SKS7_9TELE|nr:hypothetical protein AAFF_G00341060 [Aldrovandia affinis]
MAPQHARRAAGCRASRSCVMVGVACVSVHFISIRALTWLSQVKVKRQPQPLPHPQKAAGFTTPEWDRGCGPPERNKRIPYPPRDLAACPPQLCEAVRRTPMDQDVKRGCRALALVSGGPFGLQWGSARYASGVSNRTT